MSETNISNPAYRIETERLVVRCYKPSDAQLLANSVTESLDHLKPWMPWAHDEPEPIEEKATRLKSCAAGSTWDRITPMVSSTQERIACLVARAYIHVSGTINLRSDIGLKMPYV